MDTAPQLRAKEQRSFLSNISRDTGSCLQHITDIRRGPLEGRFMYAIIRAIPHTPGNPRVTNATECKAQPQQGGLSPLPHPWTYGALTSSLRARTDSQSASHGLQRGHFDGSHCHLKSLSRQWHSLFKVLSVRAMMLAHHKGGEITARLLPPIFPMSPSWLLRARDGPGLPRASL